MDFTKKVNWQSRGSEPSYVKEGEETMSEVCAKIFMHAFGCSISTCAPKHPTLLLWIDKMI
jgi:hypothetical protein